jgi:hypothetical protein
MHINAGWEAAKNTKHFLEILFEGIADVTDVLFFYE